MRPQSETPAVGSSETARPEPRAKAATPADATNAETLPTALLDEIFKRELLDHGPALYVANLEGRIIWANAGYRRLRGVARGPPLPTGEVPPAHPPLRRQGVPGGRLLPPHPAPTLPPLP